MTFLSNAFKRNGEKQTLQTMSIIKSVDKHASYPVKRFFRYKFWSFLPNISPTLSVVLLESNAFNQKQFLSRRVEKQNETNTW